MLINVAEMPREVADVRHKDQHAAAERAPPLAASSASEGATVSWEARAGRNRSTLCCRTCFCYSGHCRFKGAKQESSRGDMSTPATSCLSESPQERLFPEIAKKTSMQPFNEGRRHAKLGTGLMELSFWSWLCGDSSGVLLRQRIPEVALFCGCRLEAWYHNVRGMVAERPLGSVSSLLERFKEVSEGPDRPIAILRHESKGNPREGIPGGTIVPVLLSLQRFTEILREVVEGRIVTLQSGSLSGVWTLQSYVEPRYGLRFLSVYTCDAQLEEKHDAFSQPFQKCYTLEGVSPEPWKGRSEKFRLDAPQLDAIESKTLGIVRYAHRFHKIDLEGILLEFVVDQSGRLAVHACWSASICNARESRRFRSAWPEKQGRVQEVPRTFNVPRLEESFEMDWDDTLEEPQGFEGEKVSVDDSKQNAHAVGRARNFPALLLEFWQGDTFLGEASFGRECTASSSGLRTLNILPLGHAPPLRSDGRKLMADGAGKAIAVVSLRPSEEGRDLLTFKLGRAEGLPVIDHEEKVQAVLWNLGCNAFVGNVEYAPTDPIRP